MTDNGPQFTSDEFRRFVRSSGVKHTFSAPYHPASNGAAERAVKLIKKALEKNQRGTLSERLEDILRQYRITAHTTTGVSPAELFLGRKLKCSLDLIRPDMERSVKEKQRAQQAAHDGKTPLRTFQVGDSVYARDYRSQCRWRRGRVVAVLGTRVYHVEVDGVIWKRHVNQLMKAQNLTLLPDYRRDGHWLMDNAQTNDEDYGIHGDGQVDNENGQMEQEHAGELEHEVVARRYPLR